MMVASRPARIFAIEPRPWAAAPAATSDEAGLSALEARLAEDLSRLNYQPPDWMVPTRHADGPVADVVIIGGGMCGLAAGFALVRRGITHLRIVDAAEAGREGPWLGYARMETLRSPKQLTGPAGGIASLTFRAYYTARFGEVAWEDLYRIPRPLWMEYLRWYRRVLALPVENQVRVTEICPQEGQFRLVTSAGPIRARKVVLATGRYGLGVPHIPGFVGGLPGRCWAHSSDPIDFAALRGRQVVMVGAGASAMDNAAEALEHGAARVDLLIRRTAMPRINKLMGIGSAGFTNGYPRLSDAWRWRIMQYAETEQTPAPRNSTQRVGRHANAGFHFGCAITDIQMGERMRITTTRGHIFSADFLILATGFHIDPARVAWLANLAPQIACWADRYHPPAAEVSAGLARFPYLAPGFAMTEKHPGEAPWLQDIHSFNHAAALSLGKVSGDIPGISEGAAWLAEAICGDFFSRDIEAHWQRLVDYDKPELLGDEWTENSVAAGGS